MRKHYRLYDFAYSFFGNIPTQCKYKGDNLKSTISVLFKYFFPKGDTKELERTIRYKYPLYRPSKSNLIRNIGYDVVENEIIKEIRDNEIDNPAPFSDRTLIDWQFEEQFEKPDGFLKYAPKLGEKSEGPIDIPIDKIIGVGSTNNLDNHKIGMTFKEVLFEGVHGNGLTQASKNFLLSAESKDKEMPHKPIVGAHKTRSARGVEVTRYGDCFVINNGQQRVIFAMYLIWQRDGAKGVLRNVTVK